MPEYAVEYYDDTIRTLVTHDPYEVTQWIFEIESIFHPNSRRVIVGLDVEWRPNNRFYNNPAATLQLCVGHRCLIFQLLHYPYENMPTKLLNFLNHPSHTFVGVGVFNDVQKLYEDYEIQVGSNVVDLGELAGYLYNDNGLVNIGLKWLASVVLGKELEKPRWVRMSRWDHAWLTPEQVVYATLDAFVSYEIGSVLNASAY